jgi:hypothetical protein
MSGLRAKIAKKASKILEAQAEAPLSEDLPADEPKEDAPAGDKDLEAKVEDLSAKIDALAEAIEQLTLVEEEEKPEDLEDLKEDEEKDKDKDVTKDEMGLEAPEMLAASKTAEKTDLGDHNKTIADDFEKDKSDKAQQKLEAPAPQITKVKKSELPTMLKLADIAFEQKNDKWIVIDASDESNEKPVYEIAKGENGAGFDSASFVESLIKRMQAEGVSEVLQSVGAVEYSDPAKQAEADKKAAPELPKLPTPPAPPAAVKPEKKEDEKANVPVVKAADVQRKFVRCFNLALTALNKNLIPNPLKASFVEKLVELGMDESESVRVIEAAFRAGSIKHFASALAQTEKYLSMSDEAFVETEAMISDLNVVEPQMNASRRDLDDDADALRARASRNSLPIVTASEHNSEKRDLLGAALPKPKNWAKKDIFGKIK